MFGCFTLPNVLLLMIWLWNQNSQKQSFRCVLTKRCSENMQQIYRKTSMPKWDFNKVALQMTIALKQEFQKCKRSNSPKIALD